MPFTTRGICRGVQWNVTVLNLKERVRVIQNFVKSHSIDHRDITEIFPQPTSILVKLAKFA